MPKLTSKSRQELRSRFVRNAIPTEADFADLIAASLNQADDGVLKLPDQPLGLVRQKPDQPVLRFFADPAAEGSAWQLQLGDGDKPGFGLAGADGKLALFVDGATGNVGIGTTTPGFRLTIQGDLNATTDPESRLKYGGMLGIKSFAPQIDFIDTDRGNQWAIHVNESRMYFVREPWENEDLVLDGKGNIGMGCIDPQGKLNIRERTGTPASALKGTLLLDHEDAGGASSIVFRSKVDQGSDYSFIEYKDQNPDTQGVRASLLTIGNRNDSNDHIALMPSGNVGIGTTTPGFKLDVNGDASISDGGSLLVLKGKEIFFSDNGQIRSLDNNHRILFRRDENKMELREHGDIIFSSGSTGGQETSKMVIHGSGNVGIGTTNPGFKLDVNGNVRLGGSFQINNNGNTFKIDTFGDKVEFFLAKSWAGDNRKISWDGDNNWDAPSDEKLKTNINIETGILPRLLQIDVKSFQWKDEPESKQKQLGFIAQDVRQAFPDLVKEKPFGDQSLLSLNYTNFGILAVGAIKELNTIMAGRFQELRNEIDLLKQQVSD